MANSLPYWKLFCSALFHSFFGLSSYYHIDSMNQLQSYVQNLANQSFLDHYSIQLTPDSMAWVWSSAATCSAVGSIIGALLMKYPLEKYGKRNTVMILKSALQIIASIVQFSAHPSNCIELMFIGRLISGAAIIFAMAIPVFLTECAPVEHRGYVATMAYMGSPFWTIIGATIGLPQVLGRENTWQYVLLVPAITGIVHLCSFWVFPKSPKYLYITLRNKLAAEKSLLFYHGPEGDFDEMFREFDAEAELARGQKVAGWKRILKIRHFRWPFFICIVANMAEVLGGSDLAMQYSTGFFELLGISLTESAIFTVIFAKVPGFFAALIGLFLIERAGRRFLMLFGVAFGIVGTTLVFCAGLAPKNSTASIGLGIAGLLLGATTSYIGPSFVSYMMPGEICPQSSRSLTSSISFGASWLPSLIFVLVYPPLQIKIGAYAILPLVFAGILAFIFLYLFMPETKGKPVDEIVKRWIENETKPIILNGNDNNSFNYDTCTRF